VPSGSCSAVNHPGNIGAAALRDEAMGLADLRLVAPGLPRGSRMDGQMQMFWATSRIPWSSIGCVAAFAMSARPRGGPQVLGA
jgi:hypothetical protein